MPAEKGYFSMCMFGVGVVMVVVVVVFVVFVVLCCLLLTLNIGDHQN